MLATLSHSLCTIDRNQNGIDYQSIFVHIQIMHSFTSIYSLKYLYVKLLLISMLLCTYCSFFDFFDIKTNTIPLLFLQDRFFSSVSLLSCLDIQLFESFCIVYTFFTIFIIYYVYYRSHDSSAISLTYEYF